MKVITKMSDSTMDSICDAGVELVSELVEILRRRGLSLEHGTSVLAVATAGILKGSNVQNADMLQLVETCSPMWRELENSQGVIFDPAHRRPEATNVSVETETNLGN